MENLGQYVDMELDDEDKADRALPVSGTTPDYPWGLRISFEQCCLRKLELDPKDVSVGDLLHFAAFAKVTSVSDGEMGARIEAQIVSMSPVEDENTEFEDDD